MTDEEKAGTSAKEENWVSNEMLTNIRSRIAESNKTIRGAVVDHYVTQELDNRTAFVIKGMDKLKEMSRELKKLKPDLEACDENGKVIRREYSPSRSKEIKEQKEKMAKLERALNKSIQEGDYDNLKKATGK